MLIQKRDNGLLFKVKIQSGASKEEVNFWEGDTDLRYIQELLGHKSLKATEIYTHVNERNISHIRSPLDTFGREGNNVEKK